MSPLTPLFRSSFPRFVAVGAGGFTIDNLVLWVLVTHADLDPLPARFFSYAAAGCFTWTLNRLWTFRDGGRDRVALRGLGYVALLATGAAVNIGLYKLALTLVPVLNHFLLGATVCGAAGGLLADYLGSKHLVFARARATA